MTIVKNGTPTGFQDKNGVEIKIADRIKHVTDGSILVIDKFGKAVSPLGFKYDLTTMHCSRGMNPDGTYFAHLTDYELTDEEPPKPKGPTVKPGSDAENMAPDNVREHVNTAPKSKKYRTKAIREAEAEAAENGITVDEARKALNLQDYQDEDLCDELRARGYHGEITKTKTIKI